MTRERWVVVADRDEDAARLAAGFLARYGFWAYPTRCGREALRLARVQPLALAVIHVRLADMTGYALAEALQRWDADLPIVMTADDADARAEVRARARGIVHYAPKPLDLGALRAVAERVRLRARHSTLALSL